MYFLEIDINTFNLKFSSCDWQICQEPVPRQDQPEHTEGRGPTDQPRAGRGGPPEPPGPAHMAGHQPCVLQQGSHPSEWGMLLWADTMCFAVAVGEATCRVEPPGPYF